MTAHRQETTVANAPATTDITPTIERINTSGSIEVPKGATEIEVLCTADHCDDGDCDIEPTVAAEIKADLIADIQEGIWREHGPADERWCDWTKTDVQPWRALADYLIGRS